MTGGVFVPRVEPEYLEFSSGETGSYLSPSMFVLLAWSHTVTGQGWRKVQMTGRGLRLFYHTYTYISLI